MAAPRKPKVLKPEEALEALGQAGEAIASVKAAAPVKAILPPQEVTVDNKNVSHHFISDKHLGRLRVAADGRMSPYLELAAGAVLGNLPTFAVAVMNLQANGLKGLEKLDFASMLMMAVSVSATIALFYGHRGKGRESVGAICDEIEKRETRVMNPNPADSA